MSRVARETPLADDAVVTTQDKREAPRVPFGSLVELGLLPVGTVLCDKKQRVNATVSPDGIGERCPSVGPSTSWAHS